ncbi:unnamed protein product, partial [Discosporangium mesarthrocarpum]
MERLGRELQDVKRKYYEHRRREQVVLPHQEVLRPPSPTPPRPRLP